MSLDGLESRRSNSDSFVIQPLIQSAYRVSYSAGGISSTFRRQAVVRGQLGVRPTYKYENPIGSVCAKQHLNKHS
jgi:hypothetical protein